MSIATAHSRAQVGVEAPSVTVEVHTGGGIPRFNVVGLPEVTVKESRDRVRGAICNSGFVFPKGRIIVNLAPADLPKEGGRFDLAIAIAIIAASGQLDPARLSGHEFLGELALTGALRPTSGCLPASLKCRDSGRVLVVPPANTAEALLPSGVRVVSAGSLLSVCAHLSGRDRLPERTSATPPPAPPPAEDLRDVVGQMQAKRALEIAAAGAHNLVLYGPPGTGKTMLATRLTGILPPASEAEALEIAAVRSVCGREFDPCGWGIRPFRAPHHTASGVALVGGGSRPRPGEISLAHHGVLFLDELPEFDRRVLEVLREPLESGRIVISRAARQAEFPARFQLVAAMNPCPCGYHGHAEQRCRCAPDQVQRYQQRVSGPLLDRIDLHVEVSAERVETSGAQTEGSAAVRSRVVAARARQRSRTGKAVAFAVTRDPRAGCRLGSTESQILEQAIHRLGLSMRARDRILRVSRTIADLDEADRIRANHLHEALSYRKLDRRVR